MSTIARIAAGTAAVIACTLAVGAETPVDQSLPFLAALVVLLAFLAGRLESIVALALPLLILISITVADDSIRLFAYGAAFLFAAVTSFAGMWQPDARVELWRGVSFVIIITAALRAIPLPAERLLPLGVLIVGVAALVAALGDRDSVGVHVLPIAIAVGLITPLDPRRALLLPLLLAAVVSAMRTRTLLASFVAIALSIVAGRWAMLLVALAIGPVLLHRAVQNRRGFKLLAPPLNVSAVPLARGFIFAPSFAADVSSASMTIRLSAALLLISALFVRPALAVIYVISAIVLALPQTTARLRTLLTLPSALFVALWILMFAWSGALAAFFPLPIWSPAKPDKVEQVIGVALAPGESVIVNPDRRVSPLTLVASGSNISGLRAGTAVGRIDFVDESGRGYQRALKIGDVIDWGVFRREHLFSTRNPVPVVAEEPVERYGSDAFVPAFSRLTFAPARPITTVRVTASTALPPAARLELHRFELPR